VLGKQRQFERRALQIDDEVIIVGVDGIGRDGQPPRAHRQLQAAPDHQIHGGLPAHALREQLEDQAAVHTLVFFPRRLAVTHESGPHAVLDHVGIDIHVLRELP